MPRRKGTPAPGEATAGAILAAARAVFTEAGFSGATVPGIAARAGVAPATVYRYFQSKKALFDSLGLPASALPSPARRQRKRDLLEAALRVFGSKGYHGASLEEVAAAAGLSKAAVYLHFSSKEELFRAVIHEHTPPMELLSAASRADVPGDPEPFLGAIARSFLRLFRNPDRVNLLRLVLAEAPRFPEVGAVFTAEVVEKGATALARYLERQAASGRLDVSDPAFAAQAFIGALVSLAIQAYVLPGAPGKTPPAEGRAAGHGRPTLDEEEASGKLVALFLRAMGANPTTAPVSPQRLKAQEAKTDD